MKPYLNLKALFSRKIGQALPEYATILALVIIFCFVTLKLFGNNIGNFFNGFGQTIMSIPIR